MTKPHKHAEAIKAWADGATIEVRTEMYEWIDIPNPSWNLNMEYRIKREPKPDIVQEQLLFCNMAVPAQANLKDLSWSRWLKDGNAYQVCAKFRLTYDGDTGLLKHAELAE
jgi:hypothetical protein